MSYAYQTFGDERRIGRSSLWLPADSWRASTFADPASSGGSSFGATDGSRAVLGRLSFADAAIEYASFAWKPEKAWNLGTISYRVYWTATSGSAADVVEWGLAAQAVGNDDPLTFTVPTAIKVTDALIATSDLHVTAESAAITISGTPSVDDMVYFQLSRDATGGVDTLAQAALFIGMEVFYTTNKPNDA